MTSASDAVVGTIVRTIHEADLLGCHVTIEVLGDGQFDATVSYNVYNALGVQIASPIWGDVGGADKIYLFIVQTVADAQRHNKPVLVLEA